MTIHKLFEEQAELYPDKVAIVFEGTKLTYRELNERANQLAHYLIDMSIGPDRLVAVCLERSLELIICLLGILKAGGAYVPLDTHSPIQRIDFILEDTGTNVLITNHTIKENISKYKGKYIVIDEYNHCADKFPTTNPITTVTSHNLAYVIYTSGSTGKPKGVLLEHIGLCNLTKWYQSNLHIVAEDRASQFATSTFDAFGCEVWPFLATGASIWMVNEVIKYSPEQLVEWMVKNNITICDLPVAIWQIISELGWPDNISLRILKLGGERVIGYPTKHYSFEIWNTYGPTEDTIESVATCISNKKDTWPDSPPIGKPISNCQLYILDPNLEIVTNGVAGELYIGGDGLARGYLNRPDLTAEKFIANPFSNKPGDRMYKTGDVCRLLPDGNFEFVGRVDYQIKLRGFRIEPGEIEAAIREELKVKNTVVMMRESNNKKQLVAYIEMRNRIFTEEEKRQITEKLRYALKQRLPDYMVPSSFVIMKDFPLTSNSKLDRDGLPIPENDYISEHNYVQPENKIEQALVEIWCEIMNLKKIGVEDNFFELGGDSIISIQIITKARQQGMKLNVTDIFEHPTISALAKLTKKMEVLNVNINRSETGGLPLTPIQHWFFEQKFSQPFHWNQAILLRISPNVQTDILLKSLECIIKQHRAFDIRYCKKAKQWQQIYTKNNSVEILVHDLSKEPNYYKAYEDYASKLQGSLNFETGPLYKIALTIDNSEGDRHLLMIVHHLIMDGISWRILLADIALSYRYLLQNKELTQLLPSLYEPNTYKDWAIQLLYNTQTLMKNEIDYWLSIKENKPFLPEDFKHGENIEESVVIVYVELSEEMTKALLHEVHKAYRTQIDDILLSALMLAYHDWTGQNSLMFHLEGHGRETLPVNIDVGKTVGWFTTFYPVYLHLPHHDIDTYGEVIKSIKEQLRCIPHKGFHYGLLRYLSSNIALRQQLKEQDTAKICFNYLGQIDVGVHDEEIFKLESGIDESGASCGVCHGKKNTRDHLIEIEAIITKSHLQVSFQYSKNYYNHRTIKEFSEKYLTHLNTLIDYCQDTAHSGMTPADFPMAKIKQDQLDLLMKRILTRREQDEK